MKKQETNPGRLRFAVLATDTALFTIRDGELLVRLVQVNRPPHFPNSKGLPGGLIDPDEVAHAAAMRHIGKKAAIDPSSIYAEQLYTFSEVKRDPRGRVVAVAYLALVPWESLSTKEQEDTHDSWWATLGEAKKLAFDHDEILSAAIERLRSRVTYTTLMSKLLPKEFTLTELERAYESVLKTTLDKRNFRKKILKVGVLTPLPRKRADGPHRPAQLYKFASGKVEYIEVL